MALDILTGGFLALMGAMLGVLVLILLGLYVYFALALMTIAKKLRYKNLWLAWIPIANFFLFPILAKKHWAWGFIIFVPIVGFIFYIIWSWNIYEQRKYPGWLALAPILTVIPIIGILAGITHLVIFGLVAWMDR